jgi:Ni/Co efflux regulator RcnB
MQRVAKIGLSLLIGFFLVTSAGRAQNHEEHGHESPRPAAPRGEPHPAPKAYSRVAEPKGWNQRPAVVDRGAYQHNFQAARTFRIGPYHRPSGWRAEHWHYGEILPAVYWAPEYLIADYWLFSLEVPPAGYEWVRDDDDALLVNTGNGEILQVEYGVFG